MADGDLRILLRGAVGTGYVQRRVDHDMLGVVFMGPSDLRKVVDALPELATRHGLQLVSASVGGATGLRAALDEGDYDADGVAQLAAVCGARVLYWDLDRLDADEFVLLAKDGDESEGDPALVARSDVPVALRQRADTLLTAARRHDGDVEAVRIAFVVEGVVHEWEVSASWAVDLRGRWEVLSDDIDQTRPEPELPLDEPDPLEVERIAGLLQKMPTVISAGSHGQRSEAAAEAFPAPDGNGDWLHHRLLRQALARAQQGIQQDAVAAYKVVEDTLDETAAQLLEKHVLDDVHDAPARRIVTTDFLTELTGGHRPKPRTVTLLLSRPAVKDFLTTQKAAAKQQTQAVLPL
ncbi:hypothetical protein [Streptomyces gardneri]|uniref:hypothetical protein n=1 Tax=Streptomyces gardneri TaxID=66892 RepID=UPI003401E072